MAAEAETGLDFTPCFGGDVRQCVPLITNCVLVRYVEVLRQIAETLGLPDDAARWQAEHTTRSNHIRDLCWNETEKLFLEYNFVRDEPIPVKSLSAYWLLWAGITSGEQAAALHDSLTLFEHDYGLTFTDRVYDVPHAEFSALQWSYPVGWPPMHIMVVEALSRSGFTSAAQRISEKFLLLMLDEHERTGQLWEKYNVVDGSLTIPRERSDSVPFHGWTASVVCL